MKRRSLYWYLYDLRDRLRDQVEKVWWCYIRQHHVVKMDSYPDCYKCGRSVES